MLSMTIRTYCTNVLKKKRKTLTSVHHVVVYNVLLLWWTTKCWVVFWEFYERFGREEIFCAKCLEWFCIIRKWTNRDATPKRKDIHLPK